MTATHHDFFIIQYVKDIVRQEGRNIGVMLVMGKDARFWALGQVDRATVDPEPFIALSRLPETAGWVYQEWVNWFHELAENSGGDGDIANAILALDGQVSPVFAKNDVGEPVDLANALLPLDGQGSPFIAKGGGIIAVEPDEPPETTLRELFDRVVGKSGKGAKGEFLSRLSAIITSLNLRREPGFMEDVEVEFLPDGAPPATVRASLLIDPPSGPRTVFKVVRARTSSDAFIRQVNDAAHTFQLMAEHAFESRERCIVLTEEASRGKRPYFDYLSSFAHIVPITNPEALTNLRNILAVEESSD